MRSYAVGSSFEHAARLMRELKHGSTLLHFRAKVAGPLGSDPATLPLFPRSDPDMIVTVLSVFLDRDNAILLRLCAQEGFVQAVPCCTLFQACDVQGIHVLMIEGGMPHQLVLARTVDPRSALLPMPASTIERVRKRAKPLGNSRWDRLKRRQ
jgi:hypothetical protein